MSNTRPLRQKVPPQALEALRAADPVLGGLIDRIGPFDPAHEPDLWWSLVDSICSQQLSVKAASTILGRIEKLAPEGRRPTPREILETPDEALRACGLSRAKVVYVKDLAAKWLDGTLEPDRFADFSDEEVIEHLVRVKGIGRWTAEMVLLFTLGRHDVWPVDDLGICNAVQDVYGLEARPTRKELEQLGEPWRPWRSIASFYLWRSRTV
jgi:DNA-3-methyladenine glycosylase II